MNRGAIQQSREHGRGNFEGKDKFSFGHIELELANRYPARSFHGNFLK